MQDPEFNFEGNNDEDLERENRFQGRVFDDDERDRTNNPIYSNQNMGGLGANPFQQRSADDIGSLSNSS